MWTAKNIFSKNYRNWAEKKGAILTAAVVLYMVSSQWTGLPMDYGLMIIPWFAFLPGIKIGADSDVRNINYEMVFFMMACMGIGAVSSYVGVAGLVSPVLQKNWCLTDRQWLCW